MLKIFVPSNNIAEREYVISIIFGEFLSIDFQIFYEDNINNTEIILSNNKVIVLLFMVMKYVDSKKNF